MLVMAVKALYGGSYQYREEITLSTDRDLYISGERIWFRAFCKSNAGADSILSTILYLELYDQRFNNIVAAKFRILASEATGFIQIPAGISTGNYFIRAYTQYNRNFSPYLFCTSLVTVINPGKPLPEDELVNENEILIIPSGELFAAGKTAQLAVRLHPALCNQIAEMLVTDDEGNPVVKIMPFRNGLCLIEMTPAENTRYELVIKKNDQTEVRKTLPVVQPGTTSEKSLHSDLFDLISEIPGTKSGTMEIRADKAVYAPREKVNIRLDGQANSPFYITAVLKGSKTFNDNLLPWYLAYNPVLFSNYMRNLTSISDSLQKQIRILQILYNSLLKNEKMMSAQKDFDWIPEIRDAGISGWVRDKVSGEPLGGIMVYAADVDERNQVHICKTGDDGKFYFTLNHLSGNHNIYLTTRPVDSVATELQIHSDFENNYPESSGIIPFIHDTASLEFINALYRNARLSSIYPKNATKTEDEIAYYPLTRPVYELSVILSDFIELPVMAEVFSEIVPFTTVRNKDNHYYLQVFDERLRATYNEPLVMLDGIPVFDLDGLMAISPDQIEKVEVTNKTAYLGNFTIDGLISITSKTGNFAGLKLPSTSNFIEFEGITEESYPVFPEYHMADRNPDFRTLLFWGKAAKGTSTLSFQTSDAPGEYEILVYSADGTLKATGAFKVMR